MPRYYVKHPETDQWAIFSSICDSFITPFMSSEMLTELILDEERLTRGRELEEFFKTGRGLNQMDYEEAMELHTGTMKGTMEE